MKKNRKALGEEYSKKFKIGDLVSWVDLSFHDYDSGQTDKRLFHGILIPISKKQMGGREVCYARVMPNSKDTILELSILRIKKFKN